MKWSVKQTQREKVSELFFWIMTVIIQRRKFYFVVNIFLTDSCINKKDFLESPFFVFSQTTIFCLFFFSLVMKWRMDHAGVPFYDTVTITILLF